MPETNDPLVIKLLRQNRASLLLREDAQLKRMAKQWRQIELSLQDEMYMLAAQITDAKANGLIITEQLLARQSRYKILNAELKKQILTYTKDTASKDIAKEQLAYAQHGIDGAIAAIKAQYDFGVTFKTLSVDQFNDLSGMLGDGTPLNRLLKEAYPQSLDGIIKSLLEGTARGLGPNQIALQMAKGMSLGLDRIQLIARTEQLRAWRTSTAKQYQESGVVLYSRRLSAKDSRTCLACLMADGDIVPLDEVLSDHPRGRCTTIPIVKNAPGIEWEKGQEWFERQSPELQKEMMGPGMYDLWQKEGFNLKDLKGVSVNNVWGNSPRTKTLAEISRNSSIKKSIDISNAGRSKVKFVRDVPGSTDFIYKGEVRILKDGKFIDDNDLKVTELRNDVNKLLSAHPEVANSIRYIYKADDMKSFVRECEQVGISAKDAKDVLAFFSKNYDQIMLRPGPITSYTFDHEVGHAVWKNSGQKLDWIRTYRADSKFDRHTNYSSESQEEAFCETYAAWIAAGRSQEWSSFLVAEKVVAGVK